VKVVCIHDKDEVETFLRRHTFLHLYSLGDLDDFFWHYTTWYALKDEKRIEQLVLLYNIGTSIPVLLGLTTEPTDLMALLRSIVYILPKKFGSIGDPGR
jgi:hypothetical protein